MNNLSGIVKLLENPKRQISKNQVEVTVARAEIKDNDTSVILHLQIWDKLSYAIKDFYKKNDYLLIDGYISCQNNNKLKKSNQNFRRVTISVFKVSPILLTSKKI